MWNCPLCTAEVDPEFEVCWQCGGSREGVPDPTFVRADDAGPIDGPPVTEDALGAASVVAEVSDANPFGPDVEPVVAYTAEDRMQAHFLAQELNAMGIPAAADLHEPNESLGGMGSLPKVYVRAEDYDKARTWLAGYEATQREGHPARDE